MFERHMPHGVVRHLLIAFILLIIIVFPARCQGHSGLQDDKTMVDARSAAAYNDMSVIRKIMENKMPREILVDALRTGRYFQDIFSEHLEPLKIQFGHVCENPNEWEQRFERKDLKNNKHQGKIRWGNKNEEYGEHYWDFNHGQ